MAHLQYSSILPLPRGQVFDYVSDLRRLPTFLPENFQLAVKRAPPRIRLGSEYEYTLARGGFKNLVWMVRINAFEQDKLFSELQVMGVFDFWQNIYRFEDHGEGLTKLTSTVEYNMPFGLLGRLADDLLVRRDLQRIFRLAHENLRAQLVRQQT